MADDTIESAKAKAAGLFSKLSVALRVTPEQLEEARKNSLQEQEKVKRYVEERQRSIRRGARPIFNR